MRAAAGEDRFAIHPVRLDAVLQLVAAALPDSGDDVLMPNGVGRLALYRRPAADATILATVRRQAGGLVADITVSDAEGTALVIEQLRFQAAAIPHHSARGFYRIDWHPAPLIANLAPPHFLPAPAVLAGALNRAGERLAAQHGAAAYDAIGGRLEETATAYIVQALRQLGLPLHAGAEFTFGATAESLGVSERHHRLLRRMLRMLADDGVLAHSGRRYRVRKAPAEAGPEALVDALLAASPAMAGEIGVLRRCGGELAEVLTGRRDPLTLLFPARGEGPQARSTKPRPMRGRSTAC